MFMIKKQLNQNQSSCKVTFSLPVETVGEGRDVRVVGDFNEWSWKDAARMKAQKGKYTATVEVPANGRYEFRYCVEGNHWLNDPEADDYSFNAYGTQNCVMTIEDIASPAATPAVASPETSVNEAAAGFPGTKGKRGTRKEGAVAKSPAKGTRGATGGDETADRGTTRKSTDATSRSTITKVGGGKRAGTGEQSTSAGSSEKSMKAAGKSTGASDPAVKGTAAKSKKVAGNAKIGAEPAKDNLTMIEGIGPKIEELLRNRGIHSFRELADASNDTLRDVLTQAGARYRIHNPATWQEQARLAADHKWEELTNMQRDLKGGRR